MISDIDDEIGKIRKILEEKGIAEKMLRFRPDKRQTILVEHLWELPQIPSSEGIRADNWKYFRYRFIDAPEELYNLEKDPLETENLAQDPAYNMVLHMFRNELEYQTRKYGDAKPVSDFTPPEEIVTNF